MPRPVINGPEPLDKPALLFVEGTNDLHFFDRALKHLDIRDRVALRSYDGNDRLTAKLGDLADEMSPTCPIRRIAIMRDADDAAASAFQSVAAAIQARQWQAPTTHGAWRRAREGWEVAGYILPDGQGQGELETLLYQALGADQITGCIDAFLDCLRANGAEIPTGHQQSKHRFFATVTALPKPDARFGTLADMHPNTFWSKPVFTSLLAFLRTICG